MVYIYQCTKQKINPMYLLVYYLNKNVGRLA